MNYVIMVIVLLHLVVGFAWFIWKLEFQKKQKSDSTNQEEPLNENN